MLVLAVIVTLVLCISIIISRAVTRPIDNMIYQLNKIAEGKKDRLPPLEMYSEFNNLADASTICWINWTLTIKIIWRSSSC